MAFTVPFRQPNNAAAKSASNAITQSALDSDCTIHRLRRKPDDSGVFGTRRLRSARFFPDDGEGSGDAGPQQTTEKARTWRGACGVTSLPSERRADDNGDTATDRLPVKSETDGTIRVRAGRSRVQYATALLPAVVAESGDCSSARNWVSGAGEKTRTVSHTRAAAVGVAHVTATPHTCFAASVRSALPCERPHRAGSLWPCRSARSERLGTAERPLPAPLRRREGWQLFLLRSPQPPLSPLVTYYPRSLARAHATRRLCKQGLLRALTSKATLRITRGGGQEEKKKKLSFRSFPAAF